MARTPIAFRWAVGLFSLLTVTAASSLVTADEVKRLAKAAGGAEEIPGRAEYERSVRPILHTFCGECHSDGVNEGGWAFDDYAQYAAIVADQERWEKVRLLVTHHIMPPTGVSSPSPEQRRTLLEWIDGSVFYVDPARPDPGPATLRRLNREEYNNIVRDVFAIDSRPADRFPADDTGYGFDNIADVLSLSPLHLEKYMSAAREVAAEVVRLGPPPRVGIELRAEDINIFEGNPQQADGRLVLQSAADAVGTTVRVPVQSSYQVLIQAATAQKHEDQLLGIEFWCDDERLAVLRPNRPFDGKPGPVSPAHALVELPTGEHRLSLRVEPSVGERKTEEALASISFMKVSGPLTPIPPVQSNFLRRELPADLHEVPVLRLSGEDLDHGSGRNSLDTGRAWFASNGFRRTLVELRDSGTYRMRFKVGAQQVGDEAARFEVRLADEVFGPYEVIAGAQAEQWTEFECQLPEGQHDFQVWFVNEYTDPETEQERWLWLHEFTVEGPLEDSAGLPRETVVGLLHRSGRRLFRRSLTAEENRQLEQLVDRVVRETQSTRTALRTGMEALLVSPKFLFHPVPQPAGRAEDGVAPVDEITLASRLAAFLWSSVPDEQLLSLAEEGRLRDQFTDQVHRMIADPRSRALTDNFAGQWLQLRNLEHVAPARERFPDFDRDLARDMRQETERVFEHIVDRNRSVLEFLNADYTFINKRLAKHYGLPEPNGEGFQRVSLLDSPRRGVVTHASILTLTSLPTRTSPVNRGKWLLEQMLGIEPPPPPGDIPPLPAGQENEELSLRQRLEQHRADPSCAACHALLDPPGFALEHYDAIGRWRTEENGHPIDTSGRLISGDAFSDWSELRGLLVQQPEEFVRCLTKQLLTYALGRGVTYRDKLAIEEILMRSRKADYAFQDLILAICESVPFQQMRIEP